MAHSKKKALLFGGGGCHDYKSVCPLLETLLQEQAGFSVDYVDADMRAFHASRIVRYELVVVYHTGGELPLQAKRGLVEWMAKGGGFVGVHAAADSFKNAPEYLAMLGGVFAGHPFVRRYLVSLADREHPVTREIEGYAIEHWEKWPVFEYEVRDEQYLLDYDSRMRVLATALYQGKTWPVCWVRDWGQGRVFYLALGHNVEACQAPIFQALFANGARWAGERSGGA